FQGWRARCRRVREVFWRSSLRSRWCDIDAAGVTQNSNPHGEQSQNYAQTADIGDAPGQKSILRFQKHANRQQQRSGEQEYSPTALPKFTELHIRFKKCEQHGKQSELDDVSVRRNLHRLAPVEWAIIGQRLVDPSLIMCGGRRIQLRKNGVVGCFMMVKVAAGIEGAMNEASKYKHHASGKQPPRWCASVAEKAVR